MRVVRQRVVLILGTAVLLTAFGCQRGERTMRSDAGPGAGEAQTTEPAAAADSMVEQQQANEEQPAAEPTAEELAAREAEVSQREQAVAKREAAAAAREESKAPTPRPVERTKTPVTTEEAAPATPVAAAATGEESWRERRAEHEVTLQVAAGTTFDIEMADAVSSETAQVGDRFSARTVDDLLDGQQVAVPAGAKIEGAVAAVQALKKIGGQAQIELRFDRLVLPDGQSYPLQASFAAAGKSETKRDAGTIAGSAAAGAILGRILDKRHRDKHTVLGALVGAAVGTAIASKTPGEAVELPAGAVLTLSLDQPLTVTRSVLAD